MKRIISALALAGALSLGACATPTTTPESVIAGDALISNARGEIAKIR